MCNTPFEELNIATEIAELKQKRNIDTFYVGLKKEFNIQNQHQKSLPRKVQKIAISHPVLFVPKRKWSIDNSRGFTSYCVDGVDKNVSLLTLENKECLYTAALSILTNNIGAIERIEYTSYIRGSMIPSNMRSAHCIKDIMQYHQTTTMQHLRAIFMGLFEPYGASRMTCDSILFFIMQATQTGCVHEPYAEMGCEGYIKYQRIPPLMTECFSAVFDFKRLYNQFIFNNEQ